VMRAFVCSEFHTLRDVYCAFSTFVTCSPTFLFHLTHTPTSSLARKATGTEEAVDPHDLDSAAEEEG
jgi:hypothetical protein